MEGTSINKFVSKWLSCISNVLMTFSVLVIFWYENIKSNFFILFYEKVFFFIKVIKIIKNTSINKLILRSIFFHIVGVFNFKELIKLLSFLFES